MYSRRSGGYRWVLAGLVGAAMFTVAACGSSGTSGAGATAGTSTSVTSSSIADLQADLAKHSDLVTTLPAVPPVSKASSLRGKTVWWVPLGSAVDASFGGAVRQGLGDLGIQVHTCDGQFLPTTVASCLHQAASQHADAVMTAYVDYKMVPTSFNALASAGIPVLIAGAVNDSDKQQSATFAFADTTQIQEVAARLALEEAIVDSQGSGHLMWVGLTDSSQLTSITDYAEQFVKTNCSGCTFTKIGITSANLPKLASEAGAALTANPDTNYVVVQADTATSSVAQAVQTAGLQSKVKIIGTGPLPDTMADLQASSSPVFADAGVSLQYEGWAMDQSLVQMMTGTVPPEQITSLFRMFTRKNASGLPATADGMMSGQWFADGAAVAKTFTDAWGVS